MRKLAYLAAGTAVLAVALTLSYRAPSAQQAPASVSDSAAAPFLTASDTARLKGPRQPIFFRHDIHAGQYQIPCLYCHNNAANSWTANVPSVSICMGCHLVISAADSAGNPNPEIVKVRDAAANGASIRWVRVFKISEHAHFPHMRHVNAGVPCQSCHGNIQQMPRVFDPGDVNNMGWCTGCHMLRGITRYCTACHF